MKTHILLIAADPLVISCFAKTFIGTDCNYKCTCAENVQHANEIIKFLDPNIIFLNLDPNIGEGINFITSLKKIPKMKTVKIVSFSKTFNYYHSVMGACGVHLCIAPPSSQKAIWDALESSNDPVPKNL